MDRFLELAVGYSAAFQSPSIAFILTSLIIEMTPGPNMAYLAVLGASRGRIAGFSAALGVALGLTLLGVAVGLGAGSLILSHRVAYEGPLGRGAVSLLVGVRQLERRPATDGDRVRQPVSLGSIPSRVHHQPAQPQS